MFPPYIGSMYIYTDTNIPMKFDVQYLSRRSTCDFELLVEFRDDECLLEFLYSLKNVDKKVIRPEVLVHYV